MNFDFIAGATPIDPNEAEGLRLRHIQTQQELNAFESLNITATLPWAQRQKDIVNIPFIKKLHRKMYDQVWTWAGAFRKTQKNIGVDAYRIESDLFQLCGDVSFQIEHKSFHADEICARFHHRLVFIHPFVNGNGRHARLMADLLLRKLGQPEFSWGSKTYNHHDLTTLCEMRREYIAALQKADGGDYEKLLGFVRA